MKNLLRLFLILILCIFLQPASIATIPSPVNVKVGIHLLGIDQLDLYKGSYAMDYHMILKCDKICPKFTLEVMNGSIQFIQEEKSTPTEKIYRIKMLLQDNFDAKNYPFDSYWLRLEIKDQLLDKNHIKFIVDPKFVVIDPRVILHGWVYGNKIKTYSKDYTHPLLGTVYSNYVFMIELQRPALMGFLKVLLPAIIIMFFAFLSFIIGADKSLNRFGIVSGALLASVIFHLNLTASLPPLGYLTYVDTFMIINYMVLLFILFENVYIMRLVDEEKNELAFRIDKICLFSVPLSWFLIQIINAIYFLS